MPRKPAHVPARPRPTRQQIEQVIEEFAVNAYRMMAGRNIGPIVVPLLPDESHPYYWVKMNPVQDFFPRALVVLAHATLESTVRGVAKLVSTLDSAWLERKWSASNVPDLLQVAQECGWSAAPGEHQQQIERNLADLMRRRHRIAHHADLPDSEEAAIELAMRPAIWCFSAVMFEASLLMGAFPELKESSNEDLRFKVNTVFNEWVQFYRQVEGPTAFT